MISGARLHEAVEFAIKQAGSFPNTEAEAFAISSRRLTIRSVKGAIESLELSEDAGVGIRTLSGTAFGHSYTTDLSETGISEAFAQAAANSRESDPDRFNGLAESKPWQPLKDILDQELNSVDTEVKISRLLEMEELASSKHQAIVGSEAALYGDSENHVAISNSRGVKAVYQTNSCYAYLSLLARQGQETQMGTGFAASRTLSDLAFMDVATEAAEAAVGLLGGTRIESGRYPVVLAAPVAAEFVGVLASATSAEAIYKGRSMLTDKLGQRIGATSLTIYDDGRLPRALGSVPVDHEGTPTTATTVVDNGIFSAMLSDTRSALRLGLPSTGNGFRASYSSALSVAPTNFYIVPGTLKPQDILDASDGALYIQDIQGFHSGVNPVTGEFSVGAQGWVIEDGSKSRPFREITIAGDILKLFHDVEVIGSDLRFMPMSGNLGSPTIKISGLIVSGE